MNKLEEKLERFLSFLDVPPVPLIGVDMSSSSIKMVELTLGKDKKTYILNAYSIEPTPPHAFAENGEPNPELLGEALSRAWKKLGTKTRHVAFALPTSAVIMKKAKFSAAYDDDSLGDEVLVEANQHIPFSLDEVNLDWAILGDWKTPGQVKEAADENDIGDNEVLICATRKERLEAFIAAVEIGGLIAAVVDIEAHAQQSGFNLIASSLENLDNQTVALVDAGSSVLNINVFQNGAIIFSKDIPFGSHQLTDSICHTFNVSEADAEEAKRKNGNGLENYHSQILMPFLDSMGMEINRALQFFLTQATVEQIDTIILSGGCAAYESADQAVADISQIQTMIANPFSGMEIAPSMRNRVLHREAPLLMTACGLALRAFD